MRHSILTGATNPILRTQADPITDFGDDLLKLALDMKLVCHQYD